MIYPYEMYLRALIIRGYDNATIASRLRALRLAVIPDAELEEKRDELYDLIPKKALSLVRSGPKQDIKGFISKYAKHAKVLGIDEVLRVMAGTRNKDWEDALLLITDAEYRLPVTTMLLYGESLEEVKNYINTKFGFSMDIVSLELFEKYFWDIRRMTKLEIYSYISLLDGPKVREALLDAFHKKEGRVKWKISGENMLTLETVLTTVMNEAFEKFKAAVMHEDDNAVQKTIRWAELAIKAAEKHSKIAQKDAATAIENLRFELQKISQKDIQSKDDIKGDIA